MSVSVVIPAYNGRFVEEAIQSAFAQTISPREVIVVNDGSTDDTETRLRQLSKDVPPGFRWHTKPNGGEASARNLGVRLAIGDYVAFLDHDDRWRPEKLERQLAQFASDPDLALSFSGYVSIFDGHGAASGRVRAPDIPLAAEAWNPDPDRVLEVLLTGHFFVGTMSTVMVRREVLQVIPPFEESLRLGSDWKMCLEIAARRLKVGYLPDVLVERRWHGENFSRDTGLGWQYLCRVYDTFYAEHDEDLPKSVRKRASKRRAYWHLQSAIDARRHGEVRRARRHIVRAARIRPLSVRPGWVRMLGVGAAPSGTWPE